MSNTVTAQPREIPILRNGDQVRAILAGATQMRVPVKTTPPSPAYSLEWFDESPVYSPDGGEGWYWGDGWATVGPVKSPFGAPGDLLYCKETWAIEWPPFGGALTSPLLRYRADGSAQGCLNIDGYQDWYFTPGRVVRPGVCRSSTTMPKWAARIWLRVNRVWCQQVQSISYLDCLAETALATSESSLPSVNTYTCAHSAFRGDWDRDYDKKGLSWNANPWIFGCECERIER